MACDTEILVVGAGPTGLTVALQSRLLGAEVRIIEQRIEPRPWAPALAVQPRTLEILRGLGVTDTLLERSLTEVALRVHVGGWSVDGCLHDLRLPATEFPFILFVPQPEVEAVLRSRLRELGVEVEWGCQLTGLLQRGDGVDCRIRGPSGTATSIVARYVAGCDGPDSLVRQLIGARFEGRDYRRAIVIGDAYPADDLESGTAHAFLRQDGIVFSFPLPSGAWRIIAPDTEAEDDLIKAVSANVQWVKSVRPQHRLASRYRVGRVFLAGDAAHVHSPAGAQGMNTGIQDAANLGWKLALAGRGAPDILLSSYEVERRPVAKQVLRLTGLAHALEVSEALPFRIGRRWAARPVAGLVLPRPRLVSLAARAVSGLDIGYRRGAVDDVARPRRRFRPGRRLADLPLKQGPSSHLHGLIDGGGFHLLEFGGGINDGPREQISQAFEGTVIIEQISRSSLPAGTCMPAYVLVRPDGYIATAGNDSGAESARRYLARWGVPTTREMLGSGRRPDLP
jgi:2-polyprenyl-6-methoxyphenol hydroxylase-like FAD-dependent oxidoreductase